MDLVNSTHKILTTVVEECLIFPAGRTKWTPRKAATRDHYLYAEPRFAIAGRTRALTGEASRMKLIQIAFKQSAGSFRIGMQGKSQETAAVLCVWATSAQFCRDFSFGVSRDQRDDVKSTLFRLDLVGYACLLLLGSSSIIY